MKKNKQNDGISNSTERRKKSWNRTKDKSESVTHNEPLTLLKAIEEIVLLSNGCGLCDAFFKIADPALSFMSQKLNLTKIECLILSIAVENANEHLDISDYAQHFLCNNIKMLQFDNEIQNLEKKSYLKHYRNGFQIHDKALKDIIKNQAYQPETPIVHSDDELFDYIANYFEDENSNLSSFYYVEPDPEENDSFQTKEENIINLISSNPTLPFVKALNNFHFNEFDTTIVVYFCHKLVNNHQFYVDFGDLRSLLNNYFIARTFMRDLSKTKGNLFNGKIIEFASHNGIVNKEEFSLTANAIIKLLPMFQSVIQHNSALTNYNDIVKKELYYNAPESKQIANLTDLLHNSHYKSVCKRLKTNHLRGGFSIIFYGAPGTGKTETVYQIAKKTHRDIFAVNGSQIMDKYVGESEKKLKSIFDYYRNMVQSSPIAPILFFNEADSLFGKRIGVKRTVDQMNNSLQNIILEEMEKLDGILIATTNLTANMDKAFERRFLYKIRFNKPELDVKIAIWKSMLPILTDFQYRTLADKFDFCGGQIENIARKRDVQEVLYGEKSITFDVILDFCKGETLNHYTGNPIGYVC